MNSRMSLLWVLREKHWSSGQLSFLDWWCPGILSWPIFLSCSKTHNNVSPHLIGRPMKLTAKITHLKPTFEGLEINSHCMGKLYTSSIDPSHSPSSTQRVPGRFSNPTLLCVEPSFLPQKALCLASLSKSAYPELEPSCFWELWCLGSRRLCQEVCGPNSFQKPQCEGMSLAKKLFSWEGGEGVLF